MKKKNSEFRAMRELKTNLYVEKTSQNCPYCGKTMIQTIGLKDNEDYKYKDNTLLVCSDYPKCDVYCRIKPQGRSFVMISTPADKNLRMLRKAVHHYINMVVENGIFKNQLDVHKVLTNTSNLNRNSCMHIGEMQEYACNEAIATMIKILYVNREKLTKFRDWNFSCMKPLILSDEISEMKKELEYISKKQNSTNKQYNKR